MMKNSTFILMAFVLAISAGCGKTAFDHQRHTVDTQCEGCHPGALAEDSAGMPTEEMCLTCHTAKEKEAYLKMKQKHPAFFKGETSFNFTDDLIFSHAVHMDSQMECEECHTNITKVKKGSDAGIPDMAMCMKCHKEMNLPNDCEDCHTKLRKDVKPDDHKHDFMRMHGHAVREGNIKGAKNDCYVCHNKADCIACHREQKPMDHNQMWKEKGHGIASMVDRSRCMTCHKTDSCVRCHKTVEPRSHTAAFTNFPPARHCNTCHFPYKTNNCRTCHNTPLHTTATTLPLDPIADGNNGFHDSGDNCLSCHGVTEPFPHQDPGVSCTKCHK